MMKDLLDQDVMSLNTEIRDTIRNLNTRDQVKAPSYDEVPSEDMQIHKVSAKS